MSSVATMSFECESLLSHVQELEAGLPETSEGSSFFGHPPPPALDMVQVSLRSSHGDTCFVVMARTRRACSAQLFAVQQEKEHVSEPLAVIELATGDEEMVEVYDFGEPTLTEETITCTNLLAKEGDDSIGETSVVAVIGTSKSRVLCIELIVSKQEDDTCDLQKCSQKKHWEPLPLEDDLPSAVSNRGYARKYSDSSEVSVGAIVEQLPSSVPHSRSGSSVDLAAEFQSSSSRQKKSKIPFRPCGGVTSISPYVVRSHHSAMVTIFVWVAYADGTTVRLEQDAFFWSMAKADFVDELAVRSRVRQGGVEGATTVPLPTHHPSLLALPRNKTWRSGDNAAKTNFPPSEASTSGTASPGEEEEEEQEELEPNVYDALTFGGKNSTVSNDVATLSFYTSEDQLSGEAPALVSSTTDSEIYGAIKGHLIDGTTSLVRGVVGTALGAVKWGFGSGVASASGNGGDFEEEAKFEELVPPEPPVPEVFPNLHDEPCTLIHAMDLFDTPRQVTSVAVEPNGDLVAVADNLGRVMLIELSSKQVIRLWKGFRDAQCYWMQAPRPDGEHKREKRLYLVIHAKQRRVVEIWRTKHGPRVNVLQVDRGSQVVPCRGTALDDYITSCFVLKIDSTPALEKIPPQGETKISEQQKTSKILPVRTRSSLKSNIKDTAIQLRLLQQLLAETNVPTSTKAVYDAFTNIASVSDLCVALDLLAGASQLEANMGSDGATFHGVAVAYCRDVLEEVLGSETDKSEPQIQEFSSKIQYHSQLIEAFEALHKFEVGALPDDETENSAPRSSWAVEAMAWVETSEDVTSHSLEQDAIVVTAPLRFASFAKACVKFERQVADSGEDPRQSISFIDSTKTRTQILVHVFRPLVLDIYVFKVVNSIFETMGIKEEYDLMQQYFGEWFMTLSPRAAAGKSLFGLFCPITRWLQDVVDAVVKGRDSDDSEILLKVLYDFCAGASDLPRAFLLATVCREAVSIVSKQKETQTYGQVLSEEAVKPWDDLLRKLRVCLLVSLCLYGAPMGAFPVTVNNVEKGDIFSVYEWLARDELSFSQEQRDVSALESACMVSGSSVHPFSPESDAPSRWIVLQNACRSAQQHPESNPLDFNHDQPGPLILYLHEHNHPRFLAAHRALLLSGMWGQEPKTLITLKNSACALEAVKKSEKKSGGLASMVAFEIWQKQIRPVYRAFCCGFDDVPELSEDVVAPLFNDDGWRRCLSEISRDILGFLSTDQLDNDAVSALQDAVDTEKEAVTTWPPVIEDILLRSLASRTRRVDASSLQMHRAVVSAVHLSNDINAIWRCIPSLEEFLLQTSLSCSVQDFSLGLEEHSSFIKSAILDRARVVERTIQEDFGVEEIELLAELWGIGSMHVRTEFLLVMYELEKDSMVEQIVTKAPPNIDWAMFVSRGLEIACLRLHRAVKTLKKSKKFCNVVGLLDADIFQWVKEQSERAIQNSLTGTRENDDTDISLSCTHIFVLRLLNLGTSSSMASTPVTKRAHALSVMSGTLLRVIQNGQAV